MVELIRRTKSTFISWEELHSYAKQMAVKIDWTLKTLPKTITPAGDNDLVLAFLVSKELDIPLGKNGFKVGLSNFSGRNCDAVLVSYNYENTMSKLYQPEIVILEETIDEMQPEDIKTEYFYPWDNA